MNVVALILRDTFWTPSGIVRQTGYDFAHIHAANLIKEILLVEWVWSMKKRKRDKCKKLWEKEIQWSWWKFALIACYQNQVKLWNIYSNKRCNIRAYSGNYPEAAVCRCQGRSSKKVFLKKLQGSQSKRVASESLFWVLQSVTQKATPARLFSCWFCKGFTNRSSHSQKFFKIAASN